MTTLRTAAAMKVWRALYFQPGDTATAPPDRTPLERGAYLVRGLGHCSACHAPRNALGANRNMLDLAGGLIPMQNWYAPSLTDPQAAGVQDWPLDDVVARALAKHPDDRYPSAQAMRRPSLGLDDPPWPILSGRIT